MKMKGRQPKWYYCELYKTNIYYFVKWKPDPFAKYALKNYSLQIDMAGKGGYSLHLDHGFVIWTDPTDKHGSMLVHECVHTANGILQNAGVKPDFANDEAQAYLTELLFKKALA